MGWTAMIFFSGFAGFCFVRDMIWFGIFGVALVLYCLFLIYGATALVRHFTMLAPLVFDQNITSGRQLAAKTGLSDESVKVTFQGFQNMPALKGVMIDWSDVQPQETQTSQEPQTLTICPSCGAATQSNQCEYCGREVK